MATAEGNGGSQPGASKTPDGRLWFPAVGGAVAIDPERVRRTRNRVSPPVLIESLRVDGSMVPLGDGASAPPGRGELEVRYAGLSFVAPEKVRFRYRLDGFDPDWIEAGTSRVARYTNLPPGRYAFRVTACNNEGVWNDAGASLAFRLAPHFHQTSWFRALPFLAIGLLAWAVHRLRSQKLRTYAAVLAERNRIAREIHDGLSQSLTGVLLQIEAADGVLVESPAAAHGHLDRARTWARHGLAEARRAVRTLRPSSIRSLASLARVLAGTARELTRDRGVRVDVKAGADHPLSAEVGANLLRIGQEAVTNAVRYAEPSALLLELGVESRCLRLRVHDDGRGFDPDGVPAAEGGGFGIPGMRERAESLGGQLTVASRRGEGTDVVAVVPIESQDNA
jgi:signal transduction histidine kinase